MSACARGCKQARQHRPDCPDTNGCKGCLPRTAEHGWLCYGCHVRLLDMLKTAPGQVSLLITAKANTLAHPLKDDHEQRTSGADDGAPTPLNLAVVDSINAIGWVLCSWVEMICEDYQMAGPETFTVEMGATWLLAQIERLEACDGIGDLWVELADTMSQAHALAPWREQVKRIRGVACPECHRSALALYSGDENLTCQSCQAVVTPGRYAIWVRMLAQQNEEAAAG
jgi:hypothetical protein